MYKNEHGSVIFLALLTITVLMTMVTASSYILNNEIKINSYNKDRVQALYLAEAGIEYAKMKFDDNNLWNENKLIIYPSWIDNGSIKVEKENEGNKITFISEGIYNDFTRIIVATYQYSHKTFNYSTTSNASINIGNNAFIIGNDQGGDLYSSQTIDLGNNFNLSQCEPKAEEEEIFPQFDIDSLKEKADINVDSEEESPKIDGNKITYSDHGLEYENHLDISGNGILVVEGDLKIKNNADLNVNQNNNNNFIIVVTGDITVKNNINMKGLLYSQGSISLKNNSQFVGSIIAQDEIDIQNNLNFTFDNSYLDTFNKTNINIKEIISNSDSNLSFKFLSWREEVSQ